MRSITISLISTAAIVLSIGCKKSSSNPSTVTIPPNMPDTLTASAAAVNLGSVQQTIRGFGGASVFLGSLTDQEMTTLYGNTGNTQLGLSLLRIQIDPGGLAAWGTELGNAQKAISHGAIVMATPWSPPAYLKTNDSTIGGSLNTASYTAYGQYLDSFATYMSANNAPLYAISVQNEPDIVVTYVSCDWTPTQLLNFVHGYSPANGTRLIASESFQFDHGYTDPILNDSAADAHLSIVGGHIYGGGLAPYPLAVSKGKEVWMTEHLDTSTNWAGALGTAKEMNDCLATANFSVYNWWYLKRSYGPIDENDNPTKRGFVMAQFSKFIRPGYQMVTVPNNATSNIYISAYKNGASVVIVAINMGTEAATQPVTLTGGAAPASFTPYITSASQSLATGSNINVSGGGFSYVLPAQSVVSFVSN